MKRFLLSCLALPLLLIGAAAPAAPPTRTQPTTSTPTKPAPKTPVGKKNGAKKEFTGKKKARSTQRLVKHHKHRHHHKHHRHHHHNSGSGELGHLLQDIRALDREVNRLRRLLR